MALFDQPIGVSTYAAIRFGCGLPFKGGPETPAAMLARLAARDATAAAFPTVSFDAVVETERTFRALVKRFRDGETAIEDEVKAARRQRALLVQDAMLIDFVRWAETDDPFRERLVRFWGDHFATNSQATPLRAGSPAYREEAIRPNISGRFADLLIAAVTHPVMLMYLNQVASVGPASAIGQRRGRGLNENLAREVLELHTLGVGGPYGQADVTQLAELLTGLQFTLKRGFQFRPDFAEPGPEEVLGVSYGGGEAQLSDVHQVLEDIAAHPATGAHIARKLAVHFVADAPDEGLVAAMTAAYRDSGGVLRDVYAAMLDHPAAWRDFGAKIKRPFDFIASGMRALGLREVHIRQMKRNRIRRHLSLPLRRMGQRYMAPPGPDGWPEEAEAWVHPQGLAARIAWAMEASRMRQTEPPDPRDFVETALGEAASGRLIWAAGAAETRREGVGLVLASAEFNRR